MTSVLLFGGTFDPVHNGHVAMVEGARGQLHPDRVALIPAGNPWQRGRLPFASAAHRVAMLRAASAGNDIEIDERELKRQGPSYTSDTLGEWRREAPDARLHWLIGSDAFARLDSWHRAAELPSLARFVVVARAGEAIMTPKVCAETHFDVLRLAPPPVSSTAIRQRLADRQSIRGFAPDAVCDYIEQHKLYHPEETKN